MKSFYYLNNYFNIRKISRIVKKMYAHINRVSSYTDLELKERYELIRTQTNLNNKDLSNIPLLLAIINEVTYRKLGIKPYREQYICSVGMLYNFVCEMKSGEGKSLVSVITSILYSLYSKVHVVTVNDYLAQRDFEKYRDVYEFLGITVGVNYKDRADKKELYSFDVIYTSSSELIFDYLRNELLDKQNRIEIPLDTVIIDEIDFVLLDNANSKFSVSVDIGYTVRQEDFIIAKEICSLLSGTELTKDEFEMIEDDPPGHYAYCYANAGVYLTEEGFKFVEKMLKMRVSTFTNLKAYKIILNTLEAALFFMNGRDYIVEDNKIVLINRVNGRIMPNSHLEEDLHTAIEIKEGVPPADRASLSNSMSYQVFFSKYKNIVGMSATIYEASDEFEKIYQVPTAIIPTHKENKRIDNEDLFFRTNKEKYEYLVYYLKNLRNINQPILIISGTEKESFEIYKMLMDNDIDSNLLNNLSAYEEAKLIVEAGTHGRITVSTNMSGRGTDIILDQEAKLAGGLMVIVLDRYFSNRIDNQVRGRAGRQGDVGASIFYISLEDEIFKFANQKQQKKMEKILKSINRDSNLSINPVICKKLSIIVDDIQNGIQSNYLGQRQLNFYLDNVIEEQRYNFSRWLELLKSHPLDAIEECLLNNKPIKTKLAELLQLQEDNIQESIQIKCNQLGQEISELLINKLIDIIAQKEWLIYKKDMENIKAYLPLYRLHEKMIMTEYIRVCSEELISMKNRIMADLIYHFLIAQRE